MSRLSGDVIEVGCLGVEEGSACIEHVMPIVQQQSLSKLLQLSERCTCLLCIHIQDKLPLVLLVA